VAKWVHEVNEMLKILDWCRSESARCGFLFAARLSALAHTYIYTQNTTTYADTLARVRVHTLTHSNIVTSDT